MPKFEAITSGARINDNPVSTRLYVAELDATAQTLGIRNLTTNGNDYLVQPAIFSEWTDSTDTAFVSYAALETAVITSDFFFSVGGGLGAVPFAIRSTDSLPAVFTSIALRDAYYTTNPGDIADTTDLGRGREAVGIGPTDGNTVGVTAAFIRNDDNTAWIPIATNFIGPTGPAGADSTVAGPQGPPGDAFADQQITANLTIDTTNIATYRNTNVINVSTSLGADITITLGTIASFLLATPNDEFVIRFINESEPTTLTINAGTDDMIATVSSVTLNQGESLEIKLPSTGTVWNWLASSIGDSSSGPNPLQPQPLPSGNVVLAGTFDATTGTFPSGASQGGLYRITVGGTVDGQAFRQGDFLLAIVTLPSTTTFAGNWEIIDGDGDVHSWAAMQGVISDQNIIDTLVRLGFVRNSGTVNPSVHELRLVNVANRVDVNTVIDGSQVVEFSVTNHGDIASMTLQADDDVQNTFADVATLTNPTIDGTQQQTVTIAGVDTSTAKVISFRVRAVDNQGNVHLSNEYDVDVRNLATQEQVHFGTILSTEDQTNIDFTNDDISQADQAAGNYNVSGIPSDSNLYRIYFAVPTDFTNQIQTINQGSFTLFNRASTSGNQFTEVTNVTISGNTYNVLLLNVGAAVNDTYNGTTLIVS